MSTCRVLYRTVTEVSEDPEAGYEIEMELSPILAPPCPDPTEAGFYPPNLVNEGTPGPGNMTANGTGNVVYWRGGIDAPQVPTPGHEGDWHFALFNDGGVDFGGDCVGNTLRLLVVGSGTITIHMKTGFDTFYDFNLVSGLYHWDPDLHEVLDESQSVFTLGGHNLYDITYTVDTHGDAYCAHWIDVTDQGSPCGGKWGFAGFDWVPA